jgi:hypothetical protein
MLLLFYKKSVLSLKYLLNNLNYIASMKNEYDVKIKNLNFLNLL